MTAPLTIKEAAKCKTCNKDGQLIISQRIQSPSTREVVDVAVYECPERLCINNGPYNRWIVQSDMDGFVYERDHGPRGHDKEFPRKSQEQKSKGRQHIEDVLGYEYQEEQTED